MAKNVVKITLLRQKYKHKHFAYISNTQNPKLSMLKMTSLHWQKKSQPRCGLALLSITLCQDRTSTLYPGDVWAMQGMILGVWVQSLVGLEYREPTLPNTEGFLWCMLVGVGLCIGVGVCDYSFLGLAEEGCLEIHIY